MKQIYNSYLGTIENALHKKKIAPELRKSFSNYEGLAGIENRGKIKITDGVNFKPSEELLNLAKLSGVKQNGTPRVGLHPDFVHLINSRESEYHNITSTFIDIKGSTNLYKDYDNEQVYIITNTILTAAIHTCLVFGGHIQRLQGDGVFAYFGGKTVSEKDALKFSLTSTAVFTYFVKNDLRRVFELNGIQDINTRIGINIGNNHDDVLWGVTGTEDCYELTTVSLSTSLSYKAQQQALSNGIAVGEHVKSKLPDLAKYFSPNSASESFENKYNYKIFNFDWMAYLKSLPFVKSNGLDELDFFVGDTVIETDQEKLNRLRQATLGNFANKKGVISEDPTGIKIHPNRFHFDNNYE